jgi:hypothetical protein
MWGYGPLEVAASVPKLQYASGAAGCQTPGHQTATGAAGLNGTTVSPAGMERSRLGIGKVKFSDFIKVN